MAFRIPVFFTFVIFQLLFETGLNSAVAYGSMAEISQFYTLYVSIPVAIAGIRLKTFKIANHTDFRIPIGSRCPNTLRLLSSLRAGVPFTGFLFLELLPNFRT